MEKIKSFGLPIIEDCCTNFFSQNNKNNVGKYGDFSIYSIPKFFPLQIGGILVSNIENYTLNTTLDSSEKKHIINSLSYSLRNQEKILFKRNVIFNYGLKLFSKIGFHEMLIKEEGVVPYALLLKNNEIIKDLNNFKSYMSKNGIQNSVFYGKDGFFIPNHQSLNVFEVQFMYELVSYYLKNCNL
jgi:hypothetical protein